MRKIIAAINMTLDGFCDHTAVIPDEEVHEHYTRLLSDADAILYGRKTYELMKFWQPFLKDPSGEKSMDDFALAIDRLPKIVFSRTMKNEAVGWDSARLANRPLEEEISELRQQPGKDVLVGSPSLIIACLNLHLVDELQLCVHPVIAGTGLPLFKNIKGKLNLKLLRTKTLGGGAVILYYQP